MTPSRVNALEEAGADVRTASGAGEAFQTVRDWPPSVVVSDLLMPSADGFSLLREARSLYAAHRIPAIAVSGLVCKEDREAALDAGFEEHVAKPLGPDDLVTAVARRAAQRDGGRRYVACSPAGRIRWRRHEPTAGSRGVPRGSSSRRLPRARSAR